MYLSRLMLDPQHPLARRDLGSAYDMHRTLTRAFVTDAHAQPSPFLWRLETSQNTAEACTLLVQSVTPAHWDIIQSLNGYALRVQGNKKVDLGQFVQTGRRYRYRLLANPTVTRAGKRHGLTQEADQLAWLTLQGDKHGFKTLACLRVGHDLLRTHRSRSGEGITLQTVLLEGILQATDSTALQAVLRQGLGHGKSMGLGLLSLAPVANCL